MILRGGHSHGKWDVLEHVHNLFWSGERDVDDEVERFPGFIEDVGHGHGEDVGRGFDGVTIPLVSVTRSRNSSTFSKASCEIWSGLIFPSWARATVVEKVLTSSWQREDICWILVKEAAWSTL